MTKEVVMTLVVPLDPNDIIRAYAPTDTKGILELLDKHGAKGQYVVCQHPEVDDRMIHWRSLGRVAPRYNDRAQAIMHALGYPVYRVAGPVAFEHFTEADTPKVIKVQLDSTSRRVDADSA